MTEKLGYEKNRTVHYEWKCPYEVYGHRVQEQARSKMGKVS